MELCFHGQISAFAYDITSFILQQWLLQVTLKDDVQEEENASQCKENWVFKFWL